MGYYTFHDLEVRNVTKYEFVTLQKALRDKGAIHYALNEGEYSEENKIAYFYGWESCKWYDNETDLKDVSRMFPNSIFKLSCDGEDSDDFHEDYFVNGEYEYCQGRITYDKPTICCWEDNTSCEQCGYKQEAFEQHEDPDDALRYLEFEHCINCDLEGELL